MNGNKLKTIKGLKKNNEFTSKYTLEELAQEVSNHYSDCYPDLLNKKSNKFLVRFGISIASVLETIATSNLSQTKRKTNKKVF